MVTDLDKKHLKRMIEKTCRHLFSEQNRDPYMLTHGCFDRRYWGWKLVDYPEATFQRNVYPLAWLLSQTGEGSSSRKGEILAEAVLAGLQFAADIQHKDGSFDQAFPNEHSFGATAFLLHPLLESYQIVRETAAPALCSSVENCLHRGANFLCRHDETHGHIANHLAGAVLSLLVCADFFSEPKFEERADVLLLRILEYQSLEGWFLEYEGADPGYQTLCMYYLAQVFQLRPSARLREALLKSIEFLAWFVHPDGSYAGEYGSRRTGIFYPGGIALLGKEFPLASSLTQAMLRSIVDGSTVTLNDVDMGNTAPLLSNYLLLLDCLESHDYVLDADGPAVPWQRSSVCQDFPKAGLYVRGTERYYAVFGVSNGGVLKVFDSQNKNLLWNDTGYVGQTIRGEIITTQTTDVNRTCQVEGKRVEMWTSFYYLRHSTPTVLQFVLLRLLNLTVMRSIRLGNWVKTLLVHLLISGKRLAPLNLTRMVSFEPDQVMIVDTLQSNGRTTLQWLEFGRPFVAIHMASARYFQGFSTIEPGNQPHSVDLTELNTTGVVVERVVI